MPSRFAHLAEAADLCDDDREPEYMHSADAHDELERDDEMNALGVTYSRIAWSAVTPSAFISSSRSSSSCASAECMYSGSRSS